MKLQKQITLERFIEAEKCDLIRFLEWWISQHKESPEHFPLKMNYGDWYEHFSLFIYHLEEQQ